MPIQLITIALLKKCLSKGENKHHIWHWLHFKCWKYCFVIEKYKNKIIIGRCLAKSATLFSLVGEICLDGRPVLPSLLVKLKYVNDLLAAKRERRCSGPGQEQAIFTCSWRGGSLSPYSGEGITVLLYYFISVLYLSLH